LSRTLILVGALGAALALYFVFSLYVLPMSYQDSITPQRPEAVITNVEFSAKEIALGQKFVISVTAENKGQEADMQIVSIGFPNLTSGDQATITSHDFRQTPFRVKPGDPVGSSYLGPQDNLTAAYPSIEAFSRPWENDKSYTISIEVEPEAEGRFIVFTKSIAFPHTWDMAHYPRDGTMDYQKEFVQIHSLNLTKP
jgi:hypothetical protein